MNDDLQQAVPLDDTVWPGLWGKPKMHANQEEGA